jgi:mannan endo-1,4-beta-mannosidase
MSNEQGAMNKVKIIFSKRSCCRGTQRTKALALLSAICSLLFLVSCPSQPDPTEPPPPPKDVTDGMSPNATRLMNYLTDMYGEKIISGQMDTAWTTNNTMDMIARVYADTGKYPALKGFDFIDLSSSWAGYGQDQIDEAIEWWEGKNRMNGAAPAQKLLPDKPDIHGIVAFCWHWKVKNSTSSAIDFYTRNTDFRIPMSGGKLDVNSAAFTQTIKPDLDKAAALLQQLKDKDIPVLWRPLHEAAGGWFWWGASGAKPCIALWEYMYNYLTNDKKLDNLIWVWNGQNKDWFPNPATVHIVGYDVYPQQAQDYSSQYEKFNETLNMVPAKDRIVALTENGEIPDPDKCKRDNAMWSWFMTWNDARNTNGETHKDNFWTGEYHNTNAHKNHVYKHDLVITLDELPDITKYKGLGTGD